MSSEDSISETFAELQARNDLKPPPELRAAIYAQCTKDLAPRRGPSRAVRLALSALLGTSAVLGLWLVGGRGPDTLSAALLGAAAWGAVLGTVLLLGLAPTGTCRSASGPRWVLLFALPVAFCGALVLLSTHFSPAADFFGSDQVLGTLPCGSLALGAGALVSAGIMLLWRRTDPFSPGLSGALVGLIGGLAGAMGVGFACPSVEGWHLCIGHSVAIAALVTFGALFGRRLMSP